MSDSNEPPRKVQVLSHPDEDMKFLDIWRDDEFYFSLPPALVSAMQTELDRELVNAGMKTYNLFTYFSTKGFVEGSRTVAIRSSQ